MKIDEAISLLKQYIDYNNPDIPDFYTMEEACKVVIKVLEQEPCDDAVDRQVVIDAIDDDNRNGHYSCFATNNDEECFKQIIRDLPSVTPQPQPNIKALGEDIRICQKSITDKKVLIGFNMAVALCNKHLAEGSEE